MCSVFGNKFYHVQVCGCRETVKLHRQSDWIRTESLLYQLTGFVGALCTKVRKFVNMGSGDCFPHFLVTCQLVLEQVI